MTAEHRHIATVVSIEAVAQQWARQERAAAGSAVSVGREISGRVRGGVEWHGDGEAVAVIARPMTLEPQHAELAWLAAAVGAVSAYAQVLDHVECVWPDSVIAAGREVARTAAVTLLGPGRVEAAILITRPASGDQRVTDALVGGLREAAVLLDEPERLRSEYAERCATIGRTVSIRLLPHGSCRGRVVGVGPDGGIDLHTSTGMAESVAIAQLGDMTE